MDPSSTCMQNRQKKNKEFFSVVFFFNGNIYITIKKTVENTSRGHPKTARNTTHRVKPYPHRRGHRNTPKAPPKEHAAKKKENHWQAPPKGDTTHRKQVCKEKEHKEKTRKTCRKGRGSEPPPNPTTTPGKPPPQHPTAANTGRGASPTHRKSRNSHDT